MRTGTHSRHNLSSDPILAGFIGNADGDVTCAFSPKSGTRRGGFGDCPLAGGFVSRWVWVRCSTMIRLVFKQTASAHVISNEFLRLSEYPTLGFRGDARFQRLPSQSVRPNFPRRAANR